jgi:hypothetical protein
MVGRCAATGAELPEAVVHVWGAAGATTRDVSSDATVVHTALTEVGGSAYDGNAMYDPRHTPMRAEQILTRVLGALDARRGYCGRFGGYHVLGNNCEHFATWARYGFQQSDQVGWGVAFASAGLGLLLGGPLAPLGALGGALGLLAGRCVTDKVHSLRRQEAIEHHSADLEADPEDVGVEVDWVVDCLVSHAEDCAAHDELGWTHHGLHHDGDGDGVDQTGKVRKTLLTWDSRTGISLGESDSSGAGSDGRRHRDAGASASPSTSTTSDAGVGNDGTRADGGRGAQRQRHDRSAGAHRDAGQQTRDVLSGLGNIFGAVLGGVLSVGGAVVSDIAEAHERHHRMRLERDRREAADSGGMEYGSDSGSGSGDAPPSHTMRASTVTITEISDSDLDNAGNA